MLGGEGWRNGAGTTPLPLWVTRGADWIGGSRMMIACRLLRRWGAARCSRGLATTARRGSGVMGARVDLLSSFRLDLLDIHSLNEDELSEGHVLSHTLVSDPVRRTQFFAGVVRAHTGPVPCVAGCNACLTHVPWIGCGGERRRTARCAWCRARWRTSCWGGEWAEPAFVPAPPSRKSGFVTSDVAWAAAGPCKKRLRLCPSQLPSKRTTAWHGRTRECCSSPRPCATCRGPACKTCATWCPNCGP